MNIKELAKLKKLNYDCDLIVDTYYGGVLLYVNIFFEVAHRPQIYRGVGTLTELENDYGNSWLKTTSSASQMSSLPEQYQSFLTQFNKNEEYAKYLIMLCHEQLPEVNYKRGVKIRFPDLYIKERTTLYNSSPTPNSFYLD